MTRYRAARESTVDLIRGIHLAPANTSGFRDNGKRGSAVSVNYGRRLRELPPRRRRARRSRVTGRETLFSRKLLSVREPTRATAEEAEGRDGKYVNGVGLE